jgi:hypothetical protein
MQRRPGQTDQLFVDWGVSGVAASLGARVLDLEGATTIARTTGFVEAVSGSGLYYLEDFTFPEDAGSYVIVYDDGSTDPGHTASEELEVTSSIGEPFSGDTYADTDELFRVLKIRQPTTEQELAAMRVLAAATFEIDHELERPDDDPLVGSEVSLAQVVCLERAVEHWKQEETPWGLVGNGLDGTASFIARDTFSRHAETLAPMKRRWGIA